MAPPERGDRLPGCGILAVSSDIAASSGQAIEDFATQTAVELGLGPILVADIKLPADGPCGPHNRNDPDFLFYLPILLNWYWRRIRYFPHGRLVGVARCAIAVLPYLPPRKITVGEDR
jgi:hypothetical protein